MKSNHKSENCFLRNMTCNFCDKLGHIEPACRSKQKGHRPVHQLNEMSDTESERQVLSIQSLSTGRPAIIVHCNVNGQSVSLELDTGASCSILNKAIWERVRNKSALQESTVKLTDYSGNVIPIIGQTDVDVNYNGRS